MRAIDANLLVRVLVNEPSGQRRRAAEVMGEGDIFISTTVLLETEWVLRSAYGVGSAQISRSFRRLAGLNNVRLEDPALIKQALAWADEGMDLTDALHLGRSEGCTAFLTFDKKLARIAGRLAPIDVAEP